MKIKVSRYKVADSRKSVQRVGQEVVSLPVNDLDWQKHPELEAPPSTPSRFGAEGTGSATMETGTCQHETDRHADAGE